MKLIITDDTEGVDYLLLYHPEDWERALCIADFKGWDPERRMASAFVPNGEVWYTQEVELNVQYDCLLVEFQGIWEELIG